MTSLLLQTKANGFEYLRDTFIPASLCVVKRCQLRDTLTIPRRESNGEEIWGHEGESNLLHLLEKHDHHAKIDLKEAKKILADKDKG